LVPGDPANFSPRAHCPLELVWRDLVFPEPGGLGEKTMGQTIGSRAQQVALEQRVTIADRLRVLRWSLAHLTGGAALLITTLGLTWLTAVVLLLDVFGVLPIRDS
jgi:hypothetical protein